MKRINLISVDPEAHKLIILRMKGVYVTYNRTKLSLPSLGATYIISSFNKPFLEHLFGTFRHSPLAFIDYCLQNEGRVLITLLQHFPHNLPGEIAPKSFIFLSTKKNRKKVD